MALPESVILASDGAPEGIDVALDILRRRLPGVDFITLLTPHVAPPFVLIREVGFEGSFTTDRRFRREYFISIETFTEGLESDVEAPKFHRAAEDAFTRVALGNEPVLDGAGWITGYETVEPSRRLYDWASATGPVQTADLPTNWTRHHSLHRIELKRSDVGPHLYDY